MASIRLTKEKKKFLLLALEKHYALANPRPQLTKEKLQTIQTAFENMPSQLYIKAAQKLPEYQKVINQGFIKYADEYSISSSTPRAPSRLRESYYTKIECATENKIYLKINEDINDFLLIDFKLNNFKELLIHYITKTQEAKYTDNQIPVFNLLDFSEQYINWLRPILSEQLQIEKEWGAKQASYLEAFENLLTECNTVNQVIKAYPESIHLLDQTTRTELQTKPKKQQRPKIEFTPFGENDVIVPAKTISLITNQPIGT